MASSRLRAIPCQFPSDNVTIEQTPEGVPRYFRAEDPDREEYTYRKPFILELEITRRCNLRCVHCYAEAEPREFAGELTRREIRAVLDDARVLGIRELSLTGGEVFLRPDFLGIVDDGLAQGFHVRFVTNATLLDEAMLAGLCARPIKLITVSLDSVSAAVHDRIRGLGSHRPAVHAIERLLATGFRVTVITAFSSINVADFDGLLAFCVEHGLDWQVQITSAKGRCAQSITLSPDGYYELGCKVAAAYVAKLPINIIPMDDLATFSLFAPLNTLSRTWQGRCTGGLLNIFVRANGDVTPCSALAFPACIVGSVRTGTLRAVCEEERCRDNLAWLTPRNLTGVCAACRFQAECRGGCPEILMTMCRTRTENDYCYYRIEQEQILREAMGDA
jgi:radical SAM protein with 4Fe4S-binding SPASM domain